MDAYVPNVYYWGGPLFLLVWCAFTWLYSRISGWANVAQQYPAVDNEPEQWAGWQSVRVGSVSYPALLWLAHSSEGLWLKTGPDILFRFGHTPIFIPWSQITFENADCLKLQNAQTRLSLPKPMQAQLKMYLEAA